MDKVTTLGELIKSVKIQILNHEKWGVLYVNTFIDGFRYNECMCLNCKKMTGDPETNCPGAQAVFEACVKYNLTTIMSRCGMKDEDGKLIYEPKS